MRREETDPRRIAVWLAMADHFLDTETRHSIPMTALRCVEADLGVAEAREIWCFEVSPAVAFNVWDVAGEWAGWDRRWLVGRIERLRSRWRQRPGTCRWLRYRLRVHFMHRVWCSIGRCIEILSSIESPRERERTARDLEYLGRQCFDFCADLGPSPDASDRARIRRLHPEPFYRMIKPALVPGEAPIAIERLRRALETEE